ncbi:MAG: T9SS type A sorting domain-containing protein [Salibacteraceae bacterium]
MKNLILFLLSLLGMITAISGQEEHFCKPNTITTNPDVTGDFDWRLELLNNGNVFIPTGPQQINFGSPFYYPQGQPNLVTPGIPLLKDFHPEDGWEVVYFDFGTPNNAVNDPIFALYNKYKGILRVFMLLINDDAEAKRAMMFLEWGVSSDNVQMGNAYLSAYKTPMDAMDKFNQQNYDLKFVKPNKYVVDQHFWLFADFPIIYDPCICVNESYLNFRASLVQESDIQMQINQTTINNSQVMQGGATQTGSDWFKATFSGYESSVSKNVNLIKDSFTLLDISETESKQIQTSGGTLKNIINAGILGTTSSWLKGISGVMNLLDYFVAGGSDEHAATNVAMVPASTAVGTITTSNDYVQHQILAPGSDGAQNLNPRSVPKYHNPLGIINLMEAPQLEYIDYNLLFSQVGVGPGILANGTSVINALPKVRQYRLKNDIKYAFNTHSDLEIESIEGSFLYRIGGPKHNGSEIKSNDYVANCKINGVSTDIHMPVGPATTKPIDFNNYEQSLFDQGVEINRWEIADNNWLDSLTFKTPYTSLSCMKNNQFRVFINRAYEWNNNGEEDYAGVNNPEISFRVRAVLNRKDGKGEPVVFIATYNVATPVNATPSENVPMCNLILDSESEITYVQELTGNGFANYSYHVEGFPSSSDPTWKSMFDDVEYYLNMSSPNVYPAGNYFGLYEVNLQGNSSQDLTIIGQSDIVSGNQIIVNNFVELQAGVTLRIDPNEMYPGCTELLEPVNNEYIDGFCRSFTPYYHKLENSNITKPETTPDINLQISPNPANDFIIVDINANEVKLEIWITDLSGKTIVSKNNYSQSKIQIPVSSVAAGMYIVFVRINNHIYSEKIVISQ